MCVLIITYNHIEQVESPVIPKLDSNAQNYILMYKGLVIALIVIMTFPEDIFDLTFFVNLSS